MSITSTDSNGRGEWQYEYEVSQIVDYRRRAALLLATTGCSSLGSGDAPDASFAPAAPEYLTKAITVIVPFPAGGVTDLWARPVVDELAQEFGVSITVEDKPGASGVTETTRFMSDGTAEG